MKIKLVIILTLLVAILFFATKIINAPTVAETEGVSYSETSITLYLIMGILLLLLAIPSFMIHPSVALLPLLFAFGSIAYAVYIMICKGMIPWG